MIETDKHSTSNKHDGNINLNNIDKVLDVLGDIIDKFKEDKCNLIRVKRSSCHETMLINPKHIVYIIPYNKESRYSFENSKIVLSNGDVYITTETVDELYKKINNVK